MERKNLELANKINNELKSLEKQFKDLQQKNSNKKGCSWKVIANGYTQTMPLDMESDIKAFAENWFEERIIKLEKQLKELE